MSIRIVSVDGYCPQGADDGYEMVTAVRDPMGIAFFQMAEMSRDGMALLDGEYRFVYANSGAGLLLDVSAEELVGRDFLLGFPPWEWTPLTEALGSDTPAHWSTVHRVDGTARVIEYESRGCLTPVGSLLIVALRDVAEKQHDRGRPEPYGSQDHREERETEYRSIFEATNDGMLIVDLDGYIAEANAAACEMYGYHYGEFIGLHVDALTHPDYRQDPAEALRSMQGGEALRSQGPNVRKDGSIFYVEGRGTHFTYRGDSHTLAVVRDVTERVQQYEILERRVEERTRELSTLLEVSHNVASTLELQPLLRVILDQLKSVMDFDGATVMAVEGREFINLHRQAPGPPGQLVQRRFTIGSEDLLWTALQQGDPVIVGDVRGDEPLAEEYRRINGELIDSALGYVRCWMGVPMILRSRVVGVLSLASRHPYSYTQHHADLVLGIANQAAVAIENARLYEQAQEVAVLEERQRLARELHDSVSQALYSIGLGAKTARALVEHDPARAVPPLDYVLSLAEKGMAEMRGLLFELRPESLEQEGLVLALRKQTAALSARHGVVINTALCAEPDAGGAVKEALYRIAQEALHNIVKHARATEIRVALECTGRQIVLEIRDNGAGFDPSGSFPGHLGLHSMRERAATFGGRLEVKSAPGAGTRLRARVPLHPDATP